MFKLFRNLKLRLACQKFGHGNIVDRDVNVVHGKYVSIGDNVTIHKDTLIHVAAKDKKVKDPIVKIGNNVHLSFRTWIAARVGITIGDDVGIAPNVVLQDYIHDYQDINVPIQNQPLVGEAPIVIESGCVLSANVVVVPGVTIGRNSMIGANAVVTCDIPPYSLAVGAPAKVIRCYDLELGQWVSC